MSLETCLGREQNVFEQGPEHADRFHYFQASIVTFKNAAAS